MVRWMRKSERKCGSIRILEITHIRLLGELYVNHNFMSYLGPEVFTNEMRVKPLSETI